MFRFLWLWHFIWLLIGADGVIGTALLWKLGFLTLLLSGDFHSCEFLLAPVFSGLYCSFPSFIVPLVLPETKILMWIFEFLFELLNFLSVCIVLVVIICRKCCELNPKKDIRVISIFLSGSFYLCYQKHICNAVMLACIFFFLMEKTKQLDWWKQTFSHILLPCG